MTEAPTFSVVIPAHNAEATIVEAISSVLVQTRSDLEVVVVDDGSVDRTGDRVATLRDDRIRLVSQQNKGLPAARNAGVARARGRLIAFLDSDDLLLARFLEHADAALGADEGAGFAYTDAYVLDDSTGRVRVRSAMARNRPPEPPPDSAPELLAALLVSNFVYVSAVVVADVLHAVGGFDERRRSSEDYELWLKIALAGYRAVRMDGRQAVYRRHRAQMSANLPRMYRSLIDVFDELSPERMPSAAHRDLLAQRRRTLRRQIRMAVPIAGAVPPAVTAAARRLRPGEKWYEQPPPEVAAALQASERI